MKLKLAITYGIIIWIITYILSVTFNPLLTTFLPNLNITNPLIIIFVTGLIGTLYIRNIETNEVLEGFLVGILFSICDIILDYIFFIIPNNHTLIFGNFTIHIISMTIVTIFMTTFLGYLAQMNINLN